MGAPTAGARGVSADEPIVFVSARATGRVRVAGPVWAVLDAGLGAVPKGLVTTAEDRAPLAIRGAEGRAAVGVGVAF